MDRKINYVGQIPLDTDLLDQNRNVMIGLGYAMQALLGTSTVVDGLACTPTGPAGMTVNVARGSIYSLQNVDGTAYGSLLADTAHQIVKQGIVQDTTNLSCPAPGTTGQSIVYLVQVAYQDTDAGSTVLPYYNSSNPAQAYNGPNNSGVSQNTVRKGVCLVQVKAGVAATTGTQTTPAPDAGFTGLFAITVANGQTTITSGNIVQLSTAPFISPKLPNVVSTVQTGASNYAVDTSGSANTVTISLSPGVSSLRAGMPVRIKIANTNTGATVINPNGIGNIAVHTRDGSALVGGELSANRIETFIYDGTYLVWQSSGATARTHLTTPVTYYVATTGSDSTGDGSVGNPWRTAQHAVDYAIGNIDSGGQAINIQRADGTYTDPVDIPGPVLGGGVINLLGNLTTPANCIITTTGASAITHGDRANFTVGGFKINTVTSGHCISGTGNCSITGKMDFGAVPTGYNHLSFSDGARLTLNSDYTISGSADCHLSINRRAEVLGISSITVTLTGTPAFSASFIRTLDLSLSYILSTLVTFTGAATGARYSSQNNSVINTAGGGGSYFPGDSVGNTSNGGIYI